MGQKHSYSLNRAKVTRQSTQIIQDEVASAASSVPARPSEPVPLGLRTSLDGSDYVRREMERQEQQKEQQKLTKSQGNATDGQGKAEQAENVPKSQENAIEADAIAASAEKVLENTFESQKIEETGEENGTEANEKAGNLPENHSKAMGNGTVAEPTEEVPQDQENALQTQASDQQVENMRQSIQNGIDANESQENRNSQTNDEVKSQKNAIDQEEIELTVEAVHEVQAVGRLSEYVSGTNDVLIEIQAVNLLIHENEEQPTEGQPIEEVPKSEENVMEQQVDIEPSVGDVQRMQAYDHSNPSDENVSEGQIGATKTSGEGVISLGKEELISPTEKEEMVSRDEQTKPDEEVISREKQTEKTTEDGLISQISKEVICAAKQLEDEKADDDVQLQKLVINGIISAEEGQQAAAEEEGGQQKQAVTELTVEEQLHEPPACDTEKTMTTVLVVDRDEHGQMSSLLNSNDVNIVEVNNRKPSNV